MSFSVAHSRSGAPRRPFLAHISSTIDPFRRCHYRAFPSESWSTYSDRNYPHSSISTSMSICSGSRPCLRIVWLLACRCRGCRPSTNWATRALAPGSEVPASIRRQSNVSGPSYLTQSSSYPLHLSVHFWNLKIGFLSLCLPYIPSYPNFARPGSTPAHRQNDSWANRAGFLRLSVRFLCFCSAAHSRPNSWPPPQVSSFIFRDPFRMAACSCCWGLFGCLGLIHSP